MRPNARQLTARDAALAAIMGANPGHTNFGVDFNGEDDDLNEMGVEFGALEAPPVPAAAGPMPSIPQLHSFWMQQQQAMRYAKQRARILEPNKGSHIKIERYNFNVNQDVVLGTALLGFNASNNPATNIRPQRFSTNAPQYGFVLLQAIQVSNVNALIGGTADAYQFSALSVGQHLDLPTLTPAIRAIIIGSYSGAVPSFLTATDTYTLCFAFNGPASVMA